MPSIRKITIESAGNGFIVHVGCALFVSETREHMLHEIERYISRPFEVEAEYAKACKIDACQPAAPASDIAQILSPKMGGINA